MKPFEDPGPPDADPRPDQFETTRTLLENQGLKRLPISMDVQNPDYNPDGILMFGFHNRERFTVNISQIEHWLEEALIERLKLDAQAQQNS